MPKPNRPTDRRPSAKASSSRRPKSAPAPKAKTRQPEPEEDFQDENMDVIEDKPQKSTSRRQEKEVKGQQKGKQQPKSNQQARLEQLDARQRKNNKLIIISAVLVVVILLGFMFGGLIIDNQRVDAVKNINTDKDKLISDYFPLPQIQAVSNSGQSAVRKLNRLLEEEIEKNGTVGVKNNIIAGLAYTYYKNPKITNSSQTCEILKSIYSKKDGNLNRSFAIQALAYMPQGKRELESIIRSKEADAESSMIALNSLPKSSTGKVSGDVLAFALEKEDADFLKKILPLVNENVDNFKEQPTAVKILIKLCGHGDNDISKNAIDLLGRCVYKPEHFEVLKNNALSENIKIRDNALGSLLVASPAMAGKALSEVLALSNDKEVKLKILNKIGSPDCNNFYMAVLPLTKSNDRDLAVNALTALGKMKNTADKGLKEVLEALKTSEIIDVKIAAAIAVRGFELRKPFNYTSNPEQLPSYALIKFIDHPDENLKKEVVTTFEKISGERRISAGEWKDWFAKEKSVLDLLIEMDSKHKLVQTKIKATLFKEAKEEFKKMEAIYVTISNEHSNKWAGFDKFLMDKGQEINLLKVTVNKHSPID